MNNKDKAKEVSVQELEEMQARIAVLEKKIAEHKLVDKALQGSEELLRLILTLSTNFIILSPDDIDDGINDVLKAIGSFAKVDRSYVFQFDKDGLEMSNTHEWCAEGIAHKIQDLQRVSVNNLPWFCEKIKGFEVIHIPDVKELPLEAIAEKKEFMREDIQSIVAVPIVSGYSIVGFLGFDSVCSKKRWPEDTISLLKIVGEIFAYALSRKQMMEAIGESESKYKTLFEHANDPILLMKGDAFVDCNTKTLETFGCTYEQIVGQPPYRFSPLFQPAGENSREKAIEKIKDALNGEPQHFEWKHCRYDGTTFDAEVSLNLIMFGGEAFIQAIIRDVTERKMAEELFRTLANSSSAGVYIVQDDKFQFVNPCFQQITGYSEDEIVGADALALVIDEDKKAVKDNALKMLRGEQLSAFEIRVSAKAEETRWILVTVTSIQYKGKQAVLGNFIDVTDRNKTELLLKESEERYRVLTEKSLVGVYLVQDNIFRYVNPAFAHILGYEPVEMIGKRGPMDFLVLEDREKAEESIRMRKNGETDGMLLEVSIIRKDGAVRRIEVYGSRAIYNGRPAELGTLLDVTEKKQLETQLQTMSMKDELTNLYNRRGFFTISEQQIKIANRTKMEMLCFFIDLDGMKWINDTLGHKEGDDALVMTASILKETFREADVVGRIGGDEFAVFAVGTSMAGTVLLVKRLQRHIDDYNIQAGKPYKLSLSIGVACYNPENPQSIDELISTADALMYKEKKEKHLQRTGIGPINH
ncbi:MAG: PAS domain S-box protein [Proteobacteria bacterium]|nr:PAS domain S-box protein [Pseudomonadota bacterium]